MTTLRIAFTTTSRTDTRKVKESRRLIDRMWDKWKECNDALPLSNERKIISDLVEHPFDLRSAIPKLDHRLLSHMVFSCDAAVSDGKSA